MKRPLWRSSVRDEIDAELAFHIEMTIRALMETGMTKNEARAEAERRFGDARSVSDECRRYGEQRDRKVSRAEFRDELKTDLSFALRQLLRAPAFSITAIATLALGIGATAAVFSALDAVVLRPLPFKHSERIVAIRQIVAGKSSSPPLVPEYLALRSSGVFENVAGVVQGMGISMKLGESPEIIAGARVSASYFDLFGAPPEIGRAFTTADDTPGAPGVALISDRLWTERFNRDRGVLGRVFQIDGSPHTVVGVTSQAFDARGSFDVMLPLALPATMSNDYQQRFLTEYARLKPGQSIAQATAAATAVDRRVLQQLPDRTSPLESYGVEIVTIQEQLVSGSRTLLYVLLGAVAFVLLIGCTNVGNLLLARGTSRSRELAVRAALGAGRARLMRQLLTENLVLGVAGSVVGLGVGALLLRLFIRIGPTSLPRLEQATIDWRVLLFTLCLGLSSCLVFGFLPALRIAGPRIFSALRDGGRFGTGAGGSRDRLRASLVALEVALAITLLIGSGLLLRSAWNIQHVDAGFDANGVFMARITLPPARYASAADITRTFDHIRDEAARIPGVRSAALSAIPPLQGMAMASSVSIGTAPTKDDSPEANVRIVSPGYFGTFGIALRAGRDFSPTDGIGSPKVVVINEALAKLLWPSRAASQAIGERINGLSPDTTANVMEIVGIAADARDEQVTVPAKPAFYVPVDQTPPMIWPLLQQSIVVAVKSATPAADASALARPLKHVIAEADPSLPVGSQRTLSRALEASQATAHATTVLLSALGAIALVLAMVGIYGVVAYFVGQRTQEIGVRMALGATDSRIWRFVAATGLSPVAVGLLLGIAISMATTRWLGALMYGVSDRDPVTLIAVTMLLALVALVATFVPARRAMRVSPAVALNQR